MELQYCITDEQLDAFLSFRRMLYKGDESYVCTSEFVLTDTIYKRTDFANECMVLPAVVKKNNAIVEAAVPQVIIREKDADFAFSTNLYCSPELAGCDARTPEAKKLNSCRREFLEKHKKPQTLEDLKSLMHTHGEFAPCRHGSGKSSSTFWSMIALPETGKVLISPDAPCKSGYIELNI